MPAFRPVLWLLPAALLCPAYGLPALVPEDAPAWFRAFGGEAPYAECLRAGFPLPPTAAEVAALPAARRVQEQSALKAVWLERLIRAREERNRVSRENLSHAALLAQRLGAPAAFVEMLRRQAAAALPYRERHVLDSAQQALLAAYGVDARELRFFVEGSGLSPEQLRDVVAWLPLPALFNVSPAPAAPPSPQELEAAVADMVEVQQELTLALQAVEDASSADAAAGQMLLPLVRYVFALRTLFSAPSVEPTPALDALARRFGEGSAAYSRERSRMQENGFFGSGRLQALDYLLH